MRLNELAAQAEKEIIAQKQRGNEYKARYQSELQMRKRRDNRIEELEASNKELEARNEGLKARLEELEYYITEHWKAKGWTQELEK